MRVSRDYVNSASIQSDSIFWGYDHLRAKKGWGSCGVSENGAAQRQVAFRNGSDESFSEKIGEFAEERPLKRMALFVSTTQVLGTGPRMRAQSGPRMCKEPGLYRRNKELMEPEEYRKWKTDIRKRSKQIPLVVDHDPIEVVYEDEELLAVVKPCGLKIHPPHRWIGGTLVNRLHGYLGSPPQTLHRLDQSTSGIVLIAKRKGKVLSELSRQFRDKEIKKDYLALVEDRRLGEETWEERTISAPIARDPIDLFCRKICSTADDSKEAETFVQLLGKGRNASLVQATPITGRTHQLRLHLRHVGLPILGDPAYGLRGPYLSEEDMQARRELRLHAWSIQFRHPATEEKMTLCAQPSQDFLSAMKSQGVVSDIV